MFEILKMYSKLFAKPSKDFGLAKYVFPSENVGLYLHIPFCKHFCDFCPYHKIKYDAVLARDYVNLIKKELSLHEIKLFDSLYIGGGTPSDDLDLLAGIFEFLRERVSREIALEVHPLDATLQKLKRIKDLGVNYISLGLQSFNDEVLIHFPKLCT